MLLLLGDEWGSPPGHDGVYSSGTEEEFDQGLRLLADPDAVMRDLLILFKTIGSDRVRDPGPQLLKVMEFRSRLESSKSLLYGTFDSDESLSDALKLKLDEWALPLRDRIPLCISLPQDVVPVEPSASATQPQLLESAKANAANGLLMQAEAAFAHAIKDGDPEALTEFAKFMRRTGRLERALALNKELLSDPVLLNSTDPQSVGYRVSSLANMGVIQRKRGSLTESRDLLHEAVQTARSSAQPVNRQLCYALDNYGHTLLGIGETDLAIKQFEESHILRRDFGSQADLAQSSINIGRTALQLGQYDKAESQFNEALALQRNDPDDHLRANTLCGVAESRLRRNLQHGVREMVEEALETNRRIQNSNGVSISHALLARLFLLQDSLDSAEQHALACQLESEKTNNYIGRGTAAWLLAEVAIAKGEGVRASDLIDRANEYADKAQNRLLSEDVAGTLRKINLEQT